MIYNWYIIGIYIIGTYNSMYDFVYININI